MVRALKEYDEKFTEYFFAAFDDFYKKGNKKEVIRLIESIIEQYGGRLFAGFSSGKK